MVVQVERADSKCEPAKAGAVKNEHAMTKLILCNILVSLDGSLKAPGTTVLSAGKDGK
jgi:hypothetical protein